MALVGTTSKYAFYLRTQHTPPTKAGSNPGVVTTQVRWQHLNSGRLCEFTISAGVLHGALKANGLAENWMDFVVKCNRAQATELLHFYRSRLGRNGAALQMLRLEYFQLQAHELHALLQEG